MGWNYHDPVRDSYRIKRLPIEKAISEAAVQVAHRARMCRVELPRKPVIRVFRAQGKRLMVLRVGRYFVSSFTWDTLIRKAANRWAWKRVADTTLQSRWKE